MILRGDDIAPDYGRLAVGIGFALLLHAVLLWGLSRTLPVQSEMPPLAVMDVTLVERAVPKPQVSQPVGSKQPDTDSVSLPAPTPTPSEPVIIEPVSPNTFLADPAPVILATPEDVIPTDNSAASIAPQRGSSPDKAYIPSRWALEPPLAEENLLNFAKDIDCLRALSVDCSDIRKDVFADYQLTETDLVYTRKYADTGMPSQFYGMSDAEIRQKLGVAIAGKNRQALIPGILSIDGPIWDAMHGVNKTCGLKRAPGSPMGVVRDCPKLLPSRFD